MNLAAAHGEFKGWCAANGQLPEPAGSQPGRRTRSLEWNFALWLACACYAAPGLPTTLELLTKTNCNVAARQFPELHHKGADIKLLLLWLAPPPAKRSMHRQVLLHHCAGILVHALTVVSVRGRS